MPMTVNVFESLVQWCSRLLTLTTPHSPSHIITCHSTTRHTIRDFIARNELQLQHSGTSTSPVCPCNLSGTFLLQIQLQLGDCIDWSLAAALFVSSPIARPQYSLFNSSFIKLILPQWRLISSSLARTLPYWLPCQDKNRNQKLNFSFTCYKILHSIIFLLTFNYIYFSYFTCRYQDGQVICSTS